MTTSDKAPLETEARVVLGHFDALAYAQTCTHGAYHVERQKMGFLRE
ncbi:MAG: hypothetical protein H7330_00910 [Hymenobacteraceae bacterium]|nr:hypothetical protein [Hymenobacteraceae bacterium]